MAPDIKIAIFGVFLVMLWDFVLRLRHTTWYANGRRGRKLIRKSQSDSRKRQQHKYNQQKEQKK